MSVEKINIESAEVSKHLHSKQDDVPGKTASEMKRFFDGMSTDVIIPKINELIEDNNTKADADNVYTKDETDAKFDTKADADNVYTKDETDGKLDTKADAESVYTKDESDVKLDTKADADNVYTKDETDVKLDTKADAGNVYTKDETDAKLDTKADAESVYTKKEILLLGLDGKESGLGVCITDIAPITHPITVKMTSDTITDFSGVQVKAYGKNLFSKNLWSGHTGGDYINGTFGEIEVNGVKCLSVDERAQYSYFTIPGDSSIAYSLKMKFYTDGDNTKNSNLKAESKDGTIRNLIVNFEVNTNRNAVVYGGEKIYFSAHSRRINIDLSYTQLELGANATEFEEYKEPVTYFANKDGSVNVDYAYPCMTLLSNNSDTIINVDYKKDINKAFAELKQAIISLGGTI